jgi:hypothetical protein
MTLRFIVFVAAAKVGAWRACQSASADRHHPGYYWRKQHKAIDNDFALSP